MMKGRIFVRHTNDIKVVHHGKYLRIEGISIEFTKEWEDAANLIHKTYNDDLWKTTLERILRSGLKEYQKGVEDGD